MLQAILSHLKPRSVRLVAVSKTRPPAAIMALYEQGQRMFGENRAPEMKEKQQLLPRDIEWHMIGHLQTNKVKTIAPFVHTIHSVDSLRLLKEIDKRTRQHARTVDCLLQFHIAREATKGGMSLEDAETMLEDGIEHLGNCRVIGVMGMGTFTEDTEQTRAEFKRLKAIFDTLKTRFFAQDPDFKEISMGMSGDYEIAVEEGSTMVRVGTLLFEPALSA